MKFQHTFADFKFPFIITGSYALCVAGIEDGYNDIDIIVPYSYNIPSHLRSLGFEYDENVDHRYIGLYAEVTSWKSPNNQKFDFLFCNSDVFFELKQRCNNSIFMQSDMIIEYRKAQCGYTKQYKEKYFEKYFDLTSKEKNGIIPLAYACYVEVDDRKIFLEPNFFNGKIAITKKLVPNYNSFSWCVWWKSNYLDPQLGEFFEIKIQEIAE